MKGAISDETFFGEGGRHRCLVYTGVFVRQHATPSTFGTSASWVILNPIEQGIQRKIEAVGTPLKEWDISINYGIKTGFNEAFIVDETKRNEILAQCRTTDERKRTDELIRPILRGKDIKRYAYHWANLYIIATFPSLHYDIEQYPAIKKHLLSFDLRRVEQTGKSYTVNGEKITARKKTNNKWFETQDAINYWDDFSKPKIVWGEISDKTKFALDQNGIFFAEATTFLLTGKNLPYLVCYLNSSLSEYLFSKIGTTTGVGTVRWKKFKIEQMLVPCISAKSERDFIRLLSGLDTGKVDEAEINHRIFEIVGLSGKEIAFVENYSQSI